MNCTEAREKLTEYIDGELELEITLALDEHCEMCSDCRDERDKLARITSMLRSVPVLPVPDAFDARLKMAVRKEGKSSFAPKKWRNVSSIAAVFVVGIFALMIYNNSDINMSGGGGVFDAPTDDQLYGVVTPFGISESIMLDEDDIEEDAVFGFGADLGEAENPWQEFNAIAGALQSSDSANMLTRRMLADGEAEETSRTEEAQAQVAPTQVVETGETTQAATVAEAAEAAEAIRALEDAMESDDADGGAPAGISDAKGALTLGDYMKLLEAELGSASFKMVSSFKSDEEIWYIEIEISPENEKLMYLGQDGKIWRDELSSSTETAY